MGMVLRYVITETLQNVCVHVCISVYVRVCVCVYHVVSSWTLAAVQKRHFHEPKVLFSAFFHTSFQPLQWVDIKAMLSKL